MTYCYLLAGEDLELARAELEGFLESQGFEPEVEREGRLAFSNEEPERGQLRRLALVHEVGELIEKGSIEDPDPDYRPDGSFAIRVQGKEGSKEDLEEKFGSVMETEENEVDLETPEEELRVYVSSGKYYLARLIEEIDRGLFEKRKNQERPFSSPVSLDPVVARVLVNLSGVKPGGHVLDPFCGTGGILIEAGLCGVGVHGLDVQEKMVEGTRENLEEYGIISHDIREGEVSEAPEIFDRQFDAAVTDLPYGGASKVEGEPLEDFLEVAPKLTDRMIVFMTDQESVNGMEPEFEIYVHKNLTRYVYIMNKETSGDLA